MDFCWFDRTVQTRHVTTLLEDGRIVHTGCPRDQVGAKPGDSGHTNGLVGHLVKDLHQSRSWSWLGLWGGVNPENLRFFRVTPLWPGLESCPVWMLLFQHVLVGIGCLVAPNLNVSCWVKSLSSLVEKEAHLCHATP